MRGYHRQQVAEMGPGAAEIWDAVLTASAHHMSQEVSIDIGHVQQTYDRSMYLELDEEYTESLDFPGPKLVLVGGTRFTGPLAMRVATDPTEHVPVHALTEGQQCTLRTTLPEKQVDTYVLSIGSTFDLVFDSPDSPEPQFSETASPSFVEITEDSPSWVNSKTILDWVVESTHEDGLDIAPDLQAALDNDGHEDDLQAIAAGWRRLLVTDTQEIPTPVRNLLGRGPGATPSGDDVIAGILLTLLRTTTTERRNQIQAIGDRLVAVATDRTTSVSAALLAQATRGRSAAPITTGLEALLSPGLSPDRQGERIAAMTTVGHSSGVDTLLGMVFAITMIAPTVGDQPRS